MVVVNVYTDIKTLNKSYSIESFHNNRYKNTGKMREATFNSYFTMLKPKAYVIKHVKNARDLECKIIELKPCN